MFNNDSLQQLKQLKQDIRESHDIAQGIVRGTSGKFGFVNLDDGREVFLAPDVMQRVIPGDRVEVTVTTSGGEKKDGNKTKIKLSGKLEKLISSELKEFVGRYLVKGKGHFVEPDVAQFSRWTFVPPKNRGKAKDGDKVRCVMGRHPYHHEGKGQAHITDVLGSPEDCGIEHRYTVAKFQLPSQWHEHTPALCDAAKTEYAQIAGEREDLSALPFVTIDSATTEDMDDALYVKATDTGWELRVAIADPSAVVKASSPLDQFAQARANTVYLPGEALNMFPDSLALEAFSLCENTLRPVLMCTLRVNTDGQIEHYEFAEAAISSQQKLSYDGVEAFLSKGENTSEVAEDIQESLQQLKLLAHARFAYRQQHHLTMTHQSDHELTLNEQRKIADIVKRPQGMGHKIVEEAMLATNICAGEFLHKQQAGLFSTHGGFREDRLDNVKLILSETLENPSKDITSLAGYQQTIKELNSKPEHAGNLGSLRRMLRPGKLSAQHEAHLGLGLEHYATVTSPIRRYQDLYNHRVIKAALKGEATPACSEQLAEHLQSQLATGRQAVRQMEQWLHRQYLADKLGNEYEGRVVLVNSQGIGVRLEENGIIGFALMRHNDDKPKFDQKRLKISLNEQDYQPDQAVRVSLLSIDSNQQSIQFKLLEG